MNERDSWSDLQEGRMRSSAARAAYEHARSAYELGQVVREHREERGLSQRELAERMGTTQSVVGRLEAGGSTPTITTLELIADALGLRLELRFRPPDTTPKPLARRQARKVVPAWLRRRPPHTARPADAEPQRSRRD